MKKKILLGVVAIFIIIASIFVPTRIEKAIEYANPQDDGGRPILCYYNIWGRKIKTKYEHN